MDDRPNETPRPWPVSPAQHRLDAVKRSGWRRVVILAAIGFTLGAGVFAAAYTLWKDL